MKILFVCDGNICRSPAAAAFLNSHSVNGTIEARSAGIHADNGTPMMEKMQQALTTITYNLSTQHSSQKISSENLTWADLIFTMTNPQKFILISMVPAIANKVYTLQEYIGHPTQDIQVPHSETLEAYQECARLIQRSCLELHQQLV